MDNPSNRTPPASCVKCPHACTPIFSRIHHAAYLVRRRPVCRQSRCQHRSCTPSYAYMCILHSTLLASQITRMKRRWCPCVTLDWAESAVVKDCNRAFSSSVEPAMATWIMTSEAYDETVLTGFTPRSAYASPIYMQNIGSAGQLGRFHHPIRTLLIRPSSPAPRRIRLEDCSTTYRLSNYTCGVRALARLTASLVCTSPLQAICEFVSVHCDMPVYHTG
jgi:hypothetical protein